MWYIKRPDAGVENALYLMERVDLLEEKAFSFDTEEEAKAYMVSRGLSKKCPEANAVFEEEE